MNFYTPLWHVKTKEVPCERNMEEQQSFVSKLSEIFKNQDKKTVVYYADGVHPTHNSRSTYPLLYR